MTPFSPVEKKLIKATALSIISIAISITMLTAHADTGKTQLEKAKELGKNRSTGNINPIASYRINHNNNYHVYKYSTIYIYEDPLNPGKICRLSTGISASHFCEK